MPRPLIPLALALALTAAHAEKADRLKPFVFSSDKPGSIDNANQRLGLEGNVIITRGSLQLKAEKVDVKETPDGYVQAFASGVAGQPVSFRQNRDTPGEAVEGQADQLEYDTRTETVRFIGNANVRRTRGSLVAEEVTGAVIVYDSRSEVFTLEGGNASPNPNGRTRIVMMPRAQAGDAPASAVQPGLPLQPSTTITTPRKPS
ncbi:lipopolysaccharide transport periplasmic protein LptA [Roseateles cellulosilyticus]|uniref:Lipopolysaccharide export system protein LptA n=1 Tax=Pelomonas cellulosilytica TaxID=2906762 RepID=A0ABS8XLV4_9BURK|nr:lipopolysaccharide transport periplasmic protein LptA [Pelomonas sp. P8]MCE4553759.1 lipopolysaccharide transport periplasmic protein LptA [Pelomonas sp. P8]